MSEWVWWNKGDGIAVGPRDTGCQAIVFSVEEAQAICQAVNNSLAESAELRRMHKEELEALKDLDDELRDQSQNFRDRWQTCLQQLADEKSRAEEQFKKDQNERLFLHERAIKAEDALNSASALSVSPSEEIDELEKRNLDA